MDVKVEQSENINIVHINGDVDGASALQVQERVLPLAKSGQPMLLDLSRVSFMSSAGLRVLLGLRRQLSGRGGLALTGLSAQIRDTMEITGFLEYFQIFGSLEEGKAALTSN